MIEYTPDLKHVRRAATDFGTPITPDEFDRWLEEHDAELLERAARVADFQGHIWSGAPSQSFFWVADKIRELKEDVT